MASVGPTVGLPPRKVAGFGNSVGCRLNSVSDEQLLAHGRPSVHPAGVVALAVKGIAPVGSSSSAGEVFMDAAQLGAVCELSLTPEAADLSRQFQEGQSFALSSASGDHFVTDEEDGSARFAERHHGEALAQMQWKLVRDQVHELSDALDVQKREHQAALENLHRELLFVSDGVRETAKNDLMQLAERVNAVSQLLAKERTVREASTQGVEKQFRDLCDKFEERCSRDKDKIARSQYEPLSKNKEAVDVGFLSDISSRLGDLEDRCFCLESRVLDKQLVDLAEFAEGCADWPTPTTVDESRTRTRTPPERRPNAVDEENLTGRVAALEKMAKKLEFMPKELEAVAEQVTLSEQASAHVHIAHHGSAPVIAEYSMSAGLAPLCVPSSGLPPSRMLSAVSAVTTSREAHPLADADLRRPPRLADGWKVPNVEPPTRRQTIHGVECEQEAARHRAMGSPTSGLSRMLSLSPAPTQRSTVSSTPIVHRNVVGIVAPSSISRSSPHTGSTSIPIPMASPQSSSLAGSSSPITMPMMPSPPIPVRPLTVSPGAVVAGSIQAAMAAAPLSHSASLSYVAAAAKVS